MRLDDIGHDTQRIRSELADIQSAAKKLTDVSQEVFSLIQSLVQGYHGQLNGQLILDKLHFPDMHERFDTIPKAHEETLKWLFNPENSDDNNKVEASKAFLTWLRQGRGFFHISGKVGAGKSTMMKYICSHQDLDKHLKVWCEGAQLGRGQFFFWKPGTAAQKSLKGLLRGLLHSILDQNRDLIPTALPVLWKLVTAHPTSCRELEYRDFEQGFINILQHASDSNLYKIVLFIDGLDEFEGRHLDLINTMKGWTEKYPSVLKICVSSREYSVFQVSFSSYPKLRLHEYTSTDIARMVSSQLKSSLRYASIVVSDHALQALVKLITTRAEGVFLWVSIVLAGIEDATMSGASLYELRTRIEAYPMELEPLYWYLVDLIHETDRKWAFRTLKMVQFFQSHCADVDHPETLRISLLELSFLEDIQHGSGFEPKKVDQVSHETYRKVYGRCKGFLHVRHRELASAAETPYMWTPAPMRQEVVFTHRSIVEFLETPGFVQRAAPYLCGFNCFDTACGNLLRCIEYYRPFMHLFEENLGRGGSGRESCKYSVSNFWELTIRNYLSLAIQTQRTTSSNFISFLQGFRSTFLTHSGEIGYSLKYTTQYFALIGLVIGYSDFLEQMQEIQPQSIYVQLKIFRSFYLYGCRGTWSHVTQDQFIMIMTGFLHLGINLNVGNVESSWPRWRAFSTRRSPWETVIHGFMAKLFPPSWCPGIIFDWCLRQGADPDVNLGELIPSGPRSLSWLSPKDGWEIFYYVPFGASSVGLRVHNWLPGALLLMNETSDLCQRIKENKGVIRFRDLLCYWYPGDQYFPAR